ncbi:hypothetical protein D030_5436A, partial [Vibrio parahaemolyticus AQ3810]
MGFLLTPRRYD